MKIVLAIVLFVGAVHFNSFGQAELNLKPLEDKGFVLKKKIKPYKKTINQVLKLKIKNGTLKNQELNFQLYMYVDGRAESMSEQKNVCLKPKKSVKYRFLFEPENAGLLSVELEKLEVKEVETCAPVAK